MRSCRSSVELVAAGVATLSLMRSHPLSRALLEGGNDEPLGLLAVGDLDGGVGLEGDFLLEACSCSWAGSFCLSGLWLCPFFRPCHRLSFGLLFVASFLRSFGLSVSFGSSALLRLVEPLVGLLEEGHVVVERLQVEGAVDVQRPVVGNGVAQRGAVLELAAAYPAIGGVVGGVGVEPVEDGQLVERQLVGGGEVLAYSPWASRGS